MPGKRITDHQVKKYKQHRNQFNQVAAAAKAGISERSARRIDDAQVLPSQRPARSWRTRADPLSAVWDSEVVPLLKADARLNAVTLLEELQRRDPGQWDGSVLRTLQRNLRGRDSLLGRDGGEEFVLLLPATNLEQAHALGERLRAALEGSPLDSDIGPVAVTTSIGVAADVDATLEALLARADAALYQAKAAGRNRVVCDLDVGAATAA